MQRIVWVKPGRTGHEMKWVEFDTFRLPWPAFILEGVKTGEVLLALAALAAAAGLSANTARAYDLPLCPALKGATGTESVQVQSTALLGGAVASLARPDACDARMQPFPDPNPNQGLIEEPSDNAQCPSGSVRVANFCMDRYLGSLEEVQADGTVRAWSPFHNPTHPGNFLGKRKQVLAPARRFRAISAKGALPQGHISEIEAALACGNHFPTPKRLCTATEWLRACQGPGPGLRLFPYGGRTEADRKPGACNDNPRTLSRGETARASPILRLFKEVKQPGDDLPSSPFSEFMDNACITQREGTISRAGAKPDCVTPEGVFDLVGNLHEWTSEKLANGHGVFRGGYFMDTYLNSPGCTYKTVVHTQDHYEYSTGFRCCADLAPQPND